MIGISPAAPGFRNQLLNALSPATLAAIMPRLTCVPLASRQSLYAADEPIDTVYFIETGMVSLISTLGDGFQAEVGIVGNAGVLGVSLISGVDTSFTAATVSLPTVAYRMSAAAFLRLFDSDIEFRKLLLGYSNALLTQISQTAACNGRHGLEERLARWLLMAHDCMDGDIIPITQEYLSTMLGVHRPSITVAAGGLQRAGLIRYGAGMITVRDRAGLEAASCECYTAVRRRTMTTASSRLPLPQPRICTEQGHTPARC